MSQGMLLVISALVGALGSYLAVARRLSGKIGTSDASDLWAESARLRVDYQQRIAALEDRVIRLEKLNSDLYHENGVLSKKISDLERENADLRRQVTDLELQLSRKGLV